MAAALGQPQGSAIYVTADFGETQIQDEIVLAYFAAFKAALQGQGKLGVYAEGAVCQAALDAGIADYTWLAGGMGMRGSRAFLDTGRATIVQDVGDRVARSPMTLEVGYCLMLNDGTAAHDGARQGATRRG